MTETEHCTIKWIDGKGNPTPDTNPPVGYCRCLGYSVPENPSYKPTPSEWYPICAAHKDVLDNNVLTVQRGGRWEFSATDPR